MCFKFVGYRITVAGNCRVTELASRGTLSSGDLIVPYKFISVVMGHQITFPPFLAVVTGFRGQEWGYFTLS